MTRTLVTRDEPAGRGAGAAAVVPLVLAAWKVAPARLVACASWLDESRVRASSKDKLLIPNNHGGPPRAQPMLHRGTV